MTAYNILKFIHVTSIIVWVGGVISLFTLNARAGRSGNADFMRGLAQQGKFFSMALFGPAALLALITGIGMVQVKHLSFGLPWISWGFAGWLLSMIVGGLITGRMANRLSKRTAAGDITLEEMAAVRRKLMNLAMLNLLILLSTVFAMVIKPG